MKVDRSDIEQRIAAIELVVEEIAKRTRHIVELEAIQDMAARIMELERALALTQGHR